MKVSTLVDDVEHIWMVPGDGLGVGHEFLDLSIRHRLLVQVELFPASFNLPDAETLFLVSDQEQF